MPARILNLEFKRGLLTNTSGSSIAEHMINSRECVADFKILSRSHSIFHLKVLETLYVRSLQPSLRKQKGCLLGLNVISFCPSVHLYYYPPLSVFFLFFLFFYFSSPFLHSSTFFHYIPSLKKKISGVNSLIRARRNRSFTFLTIYIYIYIYKYIYI